MFIRVVRPSMASKEMEKNCGELQLSARDVIFDLQMPTDEFPQVSTYTDL